MKRTTAWAWVAAATIVLSTGCASDDKDHSADRHAAHETPAPDFFQQPGGERVSPFARAQAANAARRDAMLYAHHFAEGQLNSLGRAKVLLMFEDRESVRDATVYLVDCGDGELLAQRKQAVELYFRTEDGPNPSAAHPAAPHMARLSKTESGTVKVEAVQTPDLPSGLLGPLSVGK